jgi:site-specific DNA-methyltransferase (adenine-specific)
VTPFYERDGIVIFCGDCCKIMPTMESSSFDLLLTDPPYPGLKGNIVHRGSGDALRITDSKTVGTPWNTSLNWISEAWRIAKLGAMVFCSHHCVDSIKREFPINTVVGLVSWYKRNSPLPVNNVPWFKTEFIWLFKKSPGLIWKNLSTMYDIPKLSAGCRASPERILAKGSLCAAHPTQKPLALITELLKVNTESVFDPFMGTGTTLVAAQQIGRRAVGIEISEEYCQIAVERLRQRSLWSVAAPEPTLQSKQDEMEL